MIKSEFSFFQIDIKFLFVNTIKLGQPPFPEAPQRLDPINMTRALCKIIVAMINAVMLIITSTRQATITTPAVTAGDTIRAYLSPHNTLKRSFLGIGHNLGIHITAALKNAKHNSFIGGITASLARYPGRIIDLNSPLNRRGLFTPVGDFLL